VPLFDRGKGTVRLTPAGEFLYGEAKRLLQQSEELVQQARRLSRAQRPELHVGYIANVHARLVIESATAFRKAHPDVMVKVFDSTTAEQVAALKAGQMHLGFVGFPEGAVQQGLQVERIGSTYAVIALSRRHPLAATKPVPLIAFKDEPFVTINEHAFPGARQYVLKFCEEAGFTPRIVHEAVQPIDILNLVAIGEGVALVPERMRQPPHPGVVFCELAEPVPKAESYVAWRTGDSSPLVPDFIGIAKAIYLQLMRESAGPRRPPPGARRNRTSKPRRG
jgi:DNA-binding transcriptional LysR family regulator